MYTYPIQTSASGIDGYEQCKQDDQKLRVQSDKKNEVTLYNLPKNVMKNAKTLIILDKHLNL